MGNSESPRGRERRRIAAGREFAGEAIDMCMKDLTSRSHRCCDSRRRTRAESIASLGLGELRRTSFVKISDIGNLKYGSKLFNVTEDRTCRRVATIGFERRRLKTRNGRWVREGILVGCSKRASAHFIHAKESRLHLRQPCRDYRSFACRTALDAGPADPVRKMIADTKDAY